MAVEHYEITVRGHLDPAWEGWFEALKIRREPGGQSVLYGPVTDQAALHGILARVRDLNLELIAVKRCRWAARPSGPDTAVEGE